MNALKRRIEHPQDVLKSMASQLANEIHMKNKKAVILGLSGGADSALAAHIAARATADNIVVHAYCLTDNSMPIEGMNRADSLGTKYANTTFLYEKKHIQSILNEYSSMMTEGERLDNAAINRCRRIILEQEARIHDGIIVNTKNLTDWFLGWVTLGGDDGTYPLLKFLLKTEVMKLLDEAIKWESARPEIAEVLTGCLKAEAADSCGISEYTSMEGLIEPNVDHSLCTILAASESNCEILLNSYKDSPVWKAIKQAKYLREADPFDYNQYRTTFFDA